MSRNALRREKFKAIGAAIRAIDTELAWRDWREEHEYELGTAAVQDGSVSSRLGGPQMRTLQMRHVVRGSRGLRVIQDRLEELGKAELSMGQIEATNHKM